MADFSISLTVPDNKVTELVAALRWHWGQVDDGAGGLRDRTQGELKGKLKESVEGSVKNIFTRHKKHLRDQGALNDDLALT